MKRGFTLIEILTTVSIIGILVSITAMAYASAQMRSRDGQRKVDQDTIKNALEQFYLDNKHFPASTPIGLNIYNSRWQLEPNVTNCSQGTSSLTPLFLATIPEDPQKPLVAGAECDQLTGSNQSGQYLYFVQPREQLKPQGGYYLVAKLERTNGVNMTTQIADIIRRDWRYPLGGLDFSTTGKETTHNYVLSDSLN